MIISIIALLTLVGVGTPHGGQSALMSEHHSGELLANVPSRQITVSNLQLPERSCWAFPVDRPIADPFRPPECRWCSGNRGIKFAAEPGEVVRSVASGTVWFHGVVGGTGYLTVLVEGHAVALLITIGGIEISERRSRGSPVYANDLIGVATGHVHLGVRVNGDYVDPALWLFAGAGRVRLVPVGGPARPTQIRLSCQGAMSGENRSARR